MTAKADTDIRELKELIVGRFGQLDGKIDDLKINQARFEEKVNSLDQKLDRVEVDISQRLDDLNVQFNQRLNDLNVQLNQRLNDLNVQLNQRLNDLNSQLNKRLDDTNSQIVQLQGRVTSQTNWFIGIFTVLVTGLLRILGKIAFFPNP
jgi:DNA anti-recombination protein RmuC